MSAEPNPTPLSPSNPEAPMHPRIQAQEQAIVSLGHRLRRSERVAQVSAALAVLAVLATVWVDSRARGRVQAINALTVELEDVRAEVRRLKTTERPRGVLRIDRTSDTKTAEDPFLDAAAAELELDVLYARLEVVEARSEKNASELDSALVSWGTEAKSYVDRSLATAADVRRRETTQELALVWDRIRQIELRLPR